MLPRHNKCHKKPADKPAFQFSLFLIALFTGVIFSVGVNFKAECQHFVVRWDSSLKETAPLTPSTLASEVSSFAALEVARLEIATRFLHQAQKERVVYNDALRNFRNPSLQSDSSRNIFLLEQLLTQSFRGASARSGPVNLI